MLPADAGAFGLGDWDVALRFSRLPDLPRLGKKKFGLFCWICLLFLMHFCAVVATVLLFLLTVLKTNS